MNQAIRNALDDLETAAEKVDSDYESDMINESVATIEGELEGLDELVEEWRSISDRWHDEGHHTAYNIGMKCADELERELE